MLKLLRNNLNEYAISHDEANLFLIFQNNSLTTMELSEGLEMFPYYQTLTDFIGVLGLLNSLKGSTLLVIKSSNSVGTINGAEISSIKKVGLYNVFGSGSKNEEYSKRIAALFEDGTFYFSKSADLTLNCQSSSSHSPKDVQFIWNFKILKDFYQNTIQSSFYIEVIRGFVECKRFTNINLALISRISCGRAGTRFQTRGINDEGYVANFVETEQILECSEMNGITSYCQIRGSVPLFWEQPGINIGKHKIKFTRSLEAMLPAFNKHFKRQINKYGTVICVSLLSESEGEKVLNNYFKEAIILSKDEKIPVDIYCFDFHAYCKRSNYENLSILMKMVSSSLDSGLYFTHDLRFEPISFQKNVFRVNCIDCLDRTNVVQQLFGLYIFNFQLETFQVKKAYAQKYIDLMRIIWYNNGDTLSKIYSGTGAIKSEYTLTGKVTAKGLLNDGLKSFTRFYKSAMTDSQAQDLIDSLLLNKNLDNYIHEKNEYLSELRERKLDFCKIDELILFVGSYNFGGFQKKTQPSDLYDWLIAPVKNYSPDVYVIGFQEIVDIDSLKNIIKEDTMNREIWENSLRSLLEDHYPKLNYTLVIQQQLVGVCLFLFSAENLLPLIKDVSIKTIKVGMNGLAGNKGSIAISLNIKDSSFCFVCAHLASGQSNVNERIENYHTIIENTIFTGGKTIDSHDYVFWFGDFNFRINLSLEDAKKKINQKDFYSMLKKDQLLQSKSFNRIFKNYTEGDITFPPTYKFDILTNVYDTSEKLRIPSWTDRILYKANPNSYYAKLNQFYYNSCDLMLSDHKPIASVFSCNVAVVNKKIRNSIVREILSEKKNEDSQSLCSNYSSIYNNQIPSRPPLPIYFSIENGSPTKKNSDGGTRILQPRESMHISKKISAINNATNKEKDTSIFIPPRPAPPLTLDSLRPHLTSPSTLDYNTSRDPDKISNSLLLIHPRDSQSMHERNKINYIESFSGSIFSPDSETSSLEFDPLRKIQNTSEPTQDNLFDLKEIDFEEQSSYLNQNAYAELDQTYNPNQIKKNTSKNNNYELKESSLKNEP